ncbi:MAG TPA: hypothetical protein VK427_27125 [Kofleriaceae bacterium]|nr:hypothetical protein [Kofleriaceae bacterium]
MRRSIAAIALLCASLALAAPKRPRPDYDGRPAPSPTVTDVALGAIRVVLFPVRIVVDYGVRWPIGKLVAAAEHSRGVRTVISYLFLQPATPTMSVIPLAFFDFGFQSSIGVRFLWTTGFLTPGSKFSLKLATGGDDWWRGDGTVLVAAPARFGGFFAGVDTGIGRRPDPQFFGIGPRTPHAARARYLQARFGVAAYVGWHELQLVAATVSHIAGTSNFNDNLSIDDQVAAGRISALPPGYRDLVVTTRYGARVALDTRGRYKRTTSGARVDGFVERVRDEEIGSWLHLDATVGGALRLDRVNEHKLDLRMRIELVLASDDVDVPFLELASFGGTRDLRGFAAGRGRDYSAATLTLDYHWPVAAWLDSTLYLGAGNVFGKRLSGLTAGKLRASMGLGLSLAGLSAERQVELWAAVGSNPLDEDFAAPSFRLVLGYSHDY